MLHGAYSHDLKYVNLILVPNWCETISALKHCPSNHKSCIYKTESSTITDRPIVVCMEEKGESRPMPLTFQRSQDHDRMARLSFPSLCVSLHMYLIGHLLAHCSGITLNIALF